MTMKPKLPLSVLALLIAGAAPVHAQSTLGGWSYDPLYDDRSLEELTDAEVFATGDEEVGDVEDVFIDESGQIQSLVVETGGILGFGEKYMTIPWHGVVVGAAGEERITIPMTEEQLENLEHLDEQPQPGPARWSTETLMDMPVNMDGVEPYGEIDDLLYDSVTGRISAVLVEPDGIEAERYALPWGEGAILQTAEEGYVYFPYTEADLATLGVFVFPVDQGQTNSQNGSAGQGNGSGASEPPDAEESQQNDPNTQ